MKSHPGSIYQKTDPSHSSRKALSSWAVRAGMLFLAIQVKLAGAAAPVPNSQFAVRWDCSSIAPMPSTPSATAASAAAAQNVNSDHVSKLFRRAPPVLLYHDHPRIIPSLTPRCHLPRACLLRCGPRPLRPDPPRSGRRMNGRG